MNDRALQSLLSDKFKLGGDATVAAGPVGRQAAADTDLKLRAEVLTYSRSHGIFAGVSLDGSSLRADNGDNEALYGHRVTQQEVLHGHVAPPDVAGRLYDELNRYAPSVRSGL